MEDVVSQQCVVRVLTDMLDQFLVRKVCCPLLTSIFFPFQTCSSTSGAVRQMSWNYHVLKEMNRQWLHHKLRHEICVFRLHKFTRQSSISDNIQTLTSTHVSSITLFNPPHLYCYFSCKKVRLFQMNVSIHPTTCQLLHSKPNTGSPPVKSTWLQSRCVKSRCSAAQLLRTAWCGIFMTK